MDMDKNTSETEDIEKRTVARLLDITSQYQQQHDLMQQEISALNEALSSKDAALKDAVLTRYLLKYRLEQRDKQLQVAYLEMQQKDLAIERIMSGTVMQAQMKFGKIIDRLAPPGSWGNRAFKWVVKCIQLLINPSLRNRGKKQPQSTVASNTSESKKKAAVGLRKSKVNDDGGQRFKSFLKDKQSRLHFPVFDKPDVSIIILTYNKACYLFDCLESIIANTQIPYQVIIVDNGSKDETSELLERLENVVAIRNEANLRFIAGCNMGASNAIAEHLLFLNDDTNVTDGWLDQLYKVMKSEPQCGAVGSKILHYDGTLQEAGSIIWVDGSVMGYGRGDDPEKPEYCYLREVDFCSACCLLVRRDIFNKIGGFDQRYFPAYYEDTDLCIAIRDLGYKIIYQPASVIYHHEYKTNSADIAQNLMIVNRPKLVEKWKHQLGGLLINSGNNVLVARNKRNKVRILVIEDRIPASYLGSGFPRSAHLVKFVAGFGYEVTFFPTASQDPIQPATGELQQLGIEVMYGENLDLTEFAAERAGYYDMIIISRPHNMQTSYEIVKAFFPGAAIVYDAEAFFALRDILRAEIDKKPMDKQLINIIVDNEIELMRKADIVVTVSEYEKKKVLEKAAIPEIEIWSHPAETHVPKVDFQDRKDILFVGSFIAGSGQPNEDAAIYFANEIFPGIHNELNCHLYIVGSFPTEDVLNLAGSDITVSGYVEDIAEYYERCKIFVVPTRFAAGIPLKLIEAMSYGIPSIVTPLIAAQLGLTDGIEALIAKDKNAFIQKSIDLYTHEALWRKLQSNSQNYARANFDPDILQKKLKEILIKAWQLKKKK